MHVERYGHGGQAVVCVHGFATSSFLWRTVAPAVALAGHSVFAVDLLGYGESDRPLDCDYSIAAQTEYLERVFTGLRIERAIVVGLDIGGGVAQRLAVHYAARVEGIVLANSVAFEECPGRDAKAVQHDTARFALRLTHGILGAAPLLRRILERSVARREVMTSRLIARYLAPFVGGEGVAHLLTLARALSADDVETLPLGSLRLPTLIVWGEEDPWLDSGLPERLQHAIPSSGLVKLPGVGRLIPEEAPDALAQLLIEHIERCVRSHERSL
ncbi:MAG TPA: alpha/beta hydrolase [Gemmatimonadaceae bacterium]|nr:alpha/beta hydrolase [Gemmatimonadaceae bacterium]